MIVYAKTPEWVIRVLVSGGQQATGLRRFFE